MTADEWRGLKVGNTIYMARSGNRRKILSVKNGSITLASTMSRNGRTTVYCKGDRYLFELLKTKRNMAEDVTPGLKDLKGAFVGSLVRNNKKIREDRAIAIAEDAQMIYKREIEDMSLNIKRLKREREAMLDLSPTDAQSLVLATDFDAKAFVEKDLKIGVDLRNLEIKLEIAQAQYKHLFENE